MSVTPESPHVPAAPTGARFDPMTGAEVTSGGAQRRQAFALQPGEPVASFNMVTSLMPLASGSAPQTYRWALGLGLLIPVLAGAFGYLAFAFVAAALLVPALYVVYMYDVNEWEDQPLGVVLGAVGAAAALGVGFTLLWHAGLLGDELAPVDFGGGASGVRWSTLLVLVLVVPVAAEVLKQVGPLVLSMRPAFDDMIDAMTFGVAAGAAFAAAETIVINRSLFSSFGTIESPNAGFWVSLILSAAIVKPIVYGAATGIALAAFSGVGAGYDGFKPAYLRGLGEALLANVAFQAGLYLASRVEGTAGAVIGLVWGALVAGVLVIRLRYLLHFAVLEAALESASSGASLKDSAVGTAFCPSCEMPLLAGANFCVVCGTSTRAGNKVTRRRNRTEDVEAAPSVKAAAVGAAPQDNSGTGAIVGAVLAVLVIGGGIGQGVAAGAAEQEPLTNDSPIVVVPSVGAGPTTEAPPKPADPPGPQPDPVEGAPALDPGLAEPTANRVAFTLAADDAELPGADDSGIPGGLPSSTVPSDPDPTDGEPTTVGIVELGNGVGFRIPTGWEVEYSDVGFAQLWGPGGYFIAEATPAPTDANALVGNHLQGLVDFGVQDLEFTTPEQLPLPTSSVVQAYVLSFRGLTASQQGGTFAVEGQAFYFVTQDGTGYTVFGMYEQGAVDSNQALVDGYNAMLNDLVSTL
jgi:hypothetical protein